MELKSGVPTFYAKSQQAWRNWLEKNHATEKAVWLIIYKKITKIPSVYYSEAVDEALCFGWIDSVANKRDEESYYQYFAQRKPKSNWSQVNKNKVAKLMAQNLMAPAGLKMIELAEQTGTWQALDDVEQIKLPEDLDKAFTNNKVAFDYWEQFSRSVKRAILEWILNAKRPETRQMRIDKTVTLAAQNIKANFKQP